MLPIYDHDDLAGCFSKLMLMLRQGLSLVMEDQAIQLPLNERSPWPEHRHGAGDQHGASSGFVPGGQSQRAGRTPANPFPAQMKVAPVSKIRDLVQLQLPGIMLRAMPVAPPQIPWHAGYSYFELEKGSELWHEMDKSGAFALHLAGEFPVLIWSFGPSVARLNNKASA